MWGAVALAATVVGGAAAVVSLWRLARRTFDPGARLRRKARNLRLPPGLPDELLVLAVDRPVAWEYRLLEASLSRELEDSRRLAEDVRLGAVAAVRRMKSRELVDWGLDLNEWARRQVGQLEALVDRPFIEAVGEDGEPGDPSKILELARRLGRLYREGLEKQIEAASITVGVGADFNVLLNLLVDEAGVCVRSIRELRDGVFLTIERQLSAPREFRPLAGEGVVRIRPTIDGEGISRELARLQAKGLL